MRVKVKDLVAAGGPMGALARFGSYIPPQDDNWKTALSIKRTLKAINAELEGVQALRSELSKAEKLSEDQEARWLALMEIDVDLDVPTYKLSELKGLRLSGADLLALDFLIEDDVSTK